MQRIKRDIQNAMDKCNTFTRELDSMRPQLGDVATDGIFNAVMMHIQVLFFLVFELDQVWSKYHGKFLSHFVEGDTSYENTLIFINTAGWIQEKNNWMNCPAYYIMLIDALVEDSHGDNLAVDFARALARKVISVVDDVGRVVVNLSGNPKGTELLEKQLNDMNKHFESRLVAHVVTSPNTDEATGQIIASNALPATDTNALETHMKELGSLIGLKQVKDDVGELTNLIHVRNLRKQRNLPITPMSCHLVFTGNPGTGKTTVARLLAKIYCALGVVSRGHLTEVDRSGLVAGYVGQTALKVQEVVQKAVGGVLFIDEAYTLYSQTEFDYGTEAIDTLLKLMEDHRDDLVVIVAGYADRMGPFLQSNPGLQSRFTKYIIFEDYNCDELFLIFKGIMKASAYKMTPAAEEKIRSVCELVVTQKSSTFGNGRTVRNIAEQCMAVQANRIVKIDNPSDDILCTIEAEDVDSIYKKLLPLKKFDNTNIRRTHRNINLATRKLARTEHGHVCISELNKFREVPPGALSEVLKGKRRMSTGLAEALKAAFGIGDDN